MYLFSQQYFSMAKYQNTNQDVKSHIWPTDGLVPKTRPTSSW